MKFPVLVYGTKHHFCVCLWSDASFMREMHPFSHLSSSFSITPLILYLLLTSRFFLNSASLSLLCIFSVMFWDCMSWRVLQYLEVTGMSYNHPSYINQLMLMLIF